MNAHGNYSLASTGMGMGGGMMGQMQQPLLQSKDLTEQAKQCQEAIEMLLQSYEGILLQARTYPTAADCTSTTSMQLQVEKIGYASETLLQTISALRISGVANNVAQLNTHVEKRSKELKDADVESQQALVSLSLEITDLLQELEHNYYTTPSFD